MQNYFVNQNEKVYILGVGKSSWRYIIYMCVRNILFYKFRCISSRCMSSSVTFT